MPYKNLYLIGLTGNIACGKSTVLALLREHGAQVIDADAVTHALQQPGQDVYQQIVAAFGEQILLAPNGPINRRVLGTIVFSDPVQLQRLEQIVHPAVHAHIDTWLDTVAAISDGPGVAVIDAIKLLEGGWKPICDSIWVVTCPPEQQLTRLMTTRGMDEAEARRRIAAQTPPSEKIAQANVLIDNSGSLAETQQQVQAAWQRISTS
jgi:dephospho-CoA kinase